MAQSAARRTLSKSSGYRRTVEPIEPVHRTRWLRNKKLGMSFEEIARQDKVSEQTVQKSVEKFEVYQSLFTDDMMQRFIMQMAMELLPVEQASLESQLSAVKRDAEGKPVLDEHCNPVPDFEARREAHRSITERLAVLQKKGAFTINTGVQVGVPSVQAVEHTTVGPSGRFAFEERLRHIQAKRSLELPAAPSDVIIKGEGVDVGEDEDDSGEENV